MHFYKSNFPQEFIQQNYSKTNEHTTQEKGKKTFLTAWCLLFGNRYGYNTPNEFQPLFCANKLCGKISEGCVNWQTTVYRQTDNNDNDRPIT